MTSLNAKLRSFKLNPSDRESFRTLVVDLRSAEKYEDLVEVYRIRAEQSQPAEAVRLYLTIADMWGPALRDDSLRADALENAVHNATQAPEIMTVLEQSFRRAEDAISLRYVLATKAADEDLDAQDRSRAAREVGELSEALGDIEGAVDAYAASARLDPRETGAVIEYLGVLRGQVPDSHDIIDPVVEELTRETGSDRDVLRVLDDKLRNMKDARARDVVPLCIELSDLAWTVTSDPEISLDYLQTAFRRAPAEARTIRDTLRELSERLPSPRASFVRLDRRLSEQLEEWDEAVQLAEREVDLQSDASVQGELLLHAADILSRSKGAASESIRFYKEAARRHASLGPTIVDRFEELLKSPDVDDRDAVLHALHEHLYTHQDWAGVHRLLESQIDQAEDDQQKVDRIFELAVFETEELEDHTKAVGTYLRAARGTDDGAVVDRVIRDLNELVRKPAARSGALLGLAELYEGRGEWEDWAEVQMRRVSDISDSAARADLHIAIARALRDHTSRTDDAASQFLAAVAIRGDDKKLLKEAKETVGQTGQPEQMLRIVEMQLEVEQRKAALSNLEIERIDLLSGPLDRQIDAIDRAFTAMNTLKNRDLKLRFEKLVDETDRIGDRMEATAIRWIEAGRRDDARDLLWAGAEHLGLESDPGSRLGLAAIERASLEPRDSERLREAVEKRENIEDLTRFYRIYAADPNVGDMDALPRIERLADLLADQGNIKEAEPLYVTLIEARPDHESPYLRLLDIYDSKGADSLVAETLEIALDNLTLAEDTAVGYLDRLRVVYADRLKEHKGTVRACRRLLALDPMHLGALDSMRDYAEVSGDNETLYEVLVTTLDNLIQPLDRSVREVDLAHLAADRLQDPARAALHWTYVVGSEHAEHDTRKRAANELVRFTVETGDLEALLSAFEHQLALSDDDEERLSQADPLLQRLLDGQAPDAAMRASSIAIEAFETAPDAILEHRLSAALAVDDKPSALTALREIHARTPDLSLDRRARLVGLMLATGTDTGQAWEMAADGLTEDVDHIDLNFAIDAYGELDQLRTLADRLDEATKEEPPDNRIPALYRAADLMFRFDDQDVVAEGYWRQILELDPDQERAFVALEGSLRDRDETAGLVELLEGRLEHVEADAAKAGVLKQLAELATDPGDREVRLVQAVELAPDDLDTRGALVELYRATEQTEKLADSLLELAQREPDAETRIKLWYSTAQLCQNKLKNKDRAAEVYELIVEASPVEEKALRRLERIYRGSKNHEGLERVLTNLAGLSDDEDRRVALWQEVAKLNEEHLEAFDKSIFALEEVLRSEPNNITVLEDVARLHGRLDQWDKHLSALERIGQATQIREIQAEVLVRAARVMHLHLERHREAFELFVRSFETAPPTDELLELTRGAATASESWSPWANVLLQLSRNESDEDKREALEVEMGRLVAEKLEQPEAAINVLLESFARRPKLGAILDVLEEIARAANQLPMLLDAYKALQAADPNNPEAIWRGLRGSAEVAESHAERPDVAFQLMTNAREHAELRERAEAELDRLAETHELWEQMVPFLDAAAAAETDPEAATTLFLRKAEIEETKLESPEQAFTSLVGAYKNGPSNERVHQALMRLAEDHDRWLDLASVLALRDETVPDVNRSAVWEEAARIYIEKLEQPETAFALIRRAWELDPTNEALGAQMEELARSSDQLVGLLEAYFHAAAAASGDDADQAWLRAARLAAELGEMEVAVKSFEPVFRNNPEDEEVRATFEEVVATDEDRALLVPVIDELIIDLRQRPLKAQWWVYQATLAEAVGNDEKAAQALQAAIKHGGETAELRPRLIDALGRIGKWDRAIKFILDEIASSEDTERKEDLYLQVKQIYLESLGQPNKATDILYRAAKALPESDRMHESVLEHLRQLEKWDDIIDYLVNRGHRADEPEVARAFYLEAATTAEEYLDDPRRAVRLVELILRKDTEDREALELKARALAALGRWQDHIKTLEQIAASSEPEAAAIAYGMAGDAFESQLFYPDKALRMWKRAHEVAPDSVRPPLEIGRLLQDAGKYDEAAKVLRTAVERLEAEEGEERALSDTLVSLGKLLEATEAEYGEVLEVLQRAVALAPSSRLAKEAYHGALDRSGGIELLLEQIDADRPEDPTPEELAVYHTRRAYVYYYEGGKRDEAHSELDRSLEQDPTSVAALALRGDIDLNDLSYEHAAGAFQVLVSTFDTIPAQTVIETPSELIAELERDDARPRYLARLGYALEHSGEVDAAYEAFTEACAAEPNPPALLGLARISLRQKNPSAARDYIEEILNNFDDPPALVSEANALTGQAAEQEGRLDDALAAYDSAVEVEEANEAAFERALDLAIKNNQPEEAIPRLKHLAEAASNAVQRARALQRMGELYSQNPATAELAARSFQNAVELAPEDPKIAEQTIKQLLAIGAPEEGLELVEPLFERIEDPKKLGGLWLIRGDLESHIPGREKDALKSYAQAVERIPESATALEKMVHAYRAADESPALAAQLEMALMKIPEDQTGIRAQALRALADVQFEDLDMVVQARSALEELRSIFPNDVRTLSRLLLVYDDEEVSEDELALSVASDLVRLGELDEGLLRTLQRLYYANDDLDAVLHVLLVLRLAGVATEEENALLNELPLRLPRFAPDALRAHLFDAYIRPSKLTEEICDVIAAAARIALAVDPEAYEQYPELAADSQAAQEYSLLSRAFGLSDESTIRSDAAQNSPTRVIATEPPHLVISEALAAQDDRFVLRFELARAMSRMRPEFVLCDRLSAFEVMGFLEAAFRPIVTDTGQLDDSLQAAVAGWEAKLGEFPTPDVPPRERYQLPSAGTLREMITTIGVRAGILASFNTQTAFMQLIDGLGAPRPTSVDELRALTEQHIELNALITFLLSDRYLDARKELNLLLTSEPDPDPDPEAVADDLIESASELVDDPQIVEEAADADESVEDEIVEEEVFEEEIVDDDYEEEIVEEEVFEEEIVDDDYEEEIVEEEIIEEEILEEEIVEEEIVEEEIIEEEIVEEEIVEEEIIEEEIVEEEIIEEEILEEEIIEEEILEDDDLSRSTPVSDPELSSSLPPENTAVRGKPDADASEVGGWQVRAGGGHEEQGQQTQIVRMPISGNQSDEGDG